MDSQVSPWTLRGILSLPAHLFLSPLCLWDISSTGSRCGDRRTRSWALVTSASHSAKTNKQTTLRQRMTKATCMKFKINNQTAPSKTWITIFPQKSILPSVYNTLMVCFAYNVSEFSLTHFPEHSVSLLSAGISLAWSGWIWQGLHQYFYLEIVTTCTDLSRKATSLWNHLSYLGQLSSEALLLSYPHLFSCSR